MTITKKHPVVSSSVFLVAALACLVSVQPALSGGLFESDVFNLPDTFATPVFQSVTFRQAYDVAPLVFVVPTNEGADPSALRIKNVTTTGFDVIHTEPSNLDGRHAAMTNLAYFAVVPGRWEIEPGVFLEAGRNDTTTTIAQAGGSWDTVNFQTTFGSAPAVQAHIQTLNSETNNIPNQPSLPWMTTAVRNVGAGSFQTALERAEVTDGGTIQTETIGYVALTQTAGTFDGGGYTVDGSGSVLFDSLISADNLTGWTDQNPDGSGVAVPFNQTFASAPLVVASMARRDGADGGWLRTGAISATDVNLTVDEDTFTDGDRGHTTEAASVFAFERAFHAFTAGNVDVHWDNGSVDTTSPVTGPYSGTDLWSDNVNWRVNSTPGTQDSPPNNVLPAATDRVNIALNDTESADVPARISTGDSFTVSTVRIGGNFGLGTGGDGILNVEQGGSLTVTGAGLGDGNLALGQDPRDGKLNISTGGQVTVANGGLLRIGVSGTGGNDLSEVTLSDAGSTLTVSGQTQVATGGRGRMIVNDGTANLDGGLRLGGLPNTGSNHRGDFTQNGGNVNVTGDLIFGGAANREGGTYYLNAGTLTVTGDIVETASSVDAAQLHIDGGTLTVGGDITVQRFAVGQDGGTTGTYAIEPGQTVTSTGTTAVGSNGDGTLDVINAGATLNSTNAVIGEGNNGDGTVTIDNGNTWTVTQFLRIGNSGTGVVELKSGTLDILGTSGNPRGLRLAENGNGDGTLIIGAPGGSGTADPVVNVSGGNTETADEGTGVITMHSGTFNQLTNNLIVGQGGSSNATFTLNDGLVDVQNQLRVGNSGTGVVVQNGGTVNVGTILDLANAAGGNGTYTMNGGILNVGDRVRSDLKIGNVNSATALALMEVIDGTVTVRKSIRIANTGGNSSGTLIVGDGTTSPVIHLNTGSASSGNNDGNFETAVAGTGTFTFNSGTINQNDNNFITGQNVGSEATVQIGGGAGAATLNILPTGTLGDWNTNGGHGIVSVLANGTVAVGNDINMGNNADANSGLELTIDGGTVRLGTSGPSPGNIDYRTLGPQDQINLRDGLLESNGGTIFLRDADTSQFSMTGGRLENFAAFNGTLTQDGGTLAAGASPGQMDISADYLFDAGILEVEITGLVQGVDPGYDFYNVLGNAVLGNNVFPPTDGLATLQVLLPTGFAWAQGDKFNVLEATSITINDDFVFDGSATGGQWVYQVIPGGRGEILQLTAVVPEPGTLAIWAILAAAGLAAGWRRRKG